MSLVDVLWDNGLVSPDDLRDFAWLRPYHEELLKVAVDLRHEWGFQPLRGVEIGVRAGYSSWIWLNTLYCTMTGIDAGADPDSEAQLQWAKQLLLKEDFQLWRVNSRDLVSIPDFDFAYIDGDHSFEGCLHDLNLCQSATFILVDDTLEGGPRLAVDSFLQGRSFVERRFPYHFGDGRPNMLSLLCKEDV